MILLTPGPTPVPEDIRAAMATPTLHHRTAEFEAIFASAREKLLRLFGMDEAVMLVSSGTGAMEAAVLNLTASKALTINAGKFGERFGKIASAHGVAYQELSYEWNTPASIDEIMDTIKADDSIDALFIQVCESAGGLRHPVEAIAEAVKAHNENIMIIADGITAVGVEPIDTTNIDALITGSQKALMLPPGLAMIGLSNQAVAKINEQDKGYYLSLKSEIKKQQQNTTAYTAGTTLVMGLDAMLSKMEEVGYEAFYAQTAKRGKALIAAIEAIGLPIYPSSPAPAMATVYTEESNAIRKILKEKYQVNIAGGQDHLKGKIFRINNMGFVEHYELSWAVNAVELALDELGIRKYDGTAVKTYSEAIR
jgi:aspartate aminotransferase-like enzyme